MIQTKQDIRLFLKADILRNRDLKGKKMWLEFLKGNIQTYKKFQFLKALRYFEFYKNNQNSLWEKIRYGLMKRRFQRIQMQTQLYISPNVFDKGLNIEHLGFVRVDTIATIGENCTILPRVLLGKKNPSVPLRSISIGNNCYLGTGCTILGPCTIGSNVVIAAGAVVIRDIPDNCMVAGNPASIKKTNISPIVE